MSCPNGGKFGKRKGDFDDQDLRLRLYASMEKILTDSEAPKPPLQSAATAASFRTLFDQSRQFAGILTLEGVVVEANRQSLVACGYVRDEVIGKLFWNCGWWNKSEQLIDTVRNGCQRAVGGELFEAKLCYYFADGSERIIDLIISPVFDSYGKVVCLNPTGTDVTERHRAESALRESESRHRFFAELVESTQPIFEPEQILQQTARKLAEYLHVDRCGYAEVEDEETFNVIGEHATSTPSIVGRWPIASFGAECLRSMLAGDPFIIEDVDLDARIAISDRAAYNATSIKSVICVPLHKGSRLIAAMAVSQSEPRQWKPSEVQMVTAVVARCWESMERARAAQAEQKMRLEALSERKRLNEVFQFAPSFMAVLDGPTHVFERANERFASLAGGRSLIGQSVAQAFPELESQGFLAILDQVYQMGQPFVASNIKVMLRRPELDNQLFEHNLEFVYQPMRDVDGKVSGILVQGIDLTERNRAERELSNVTAQSEKLRRLYETALSNTPDLVYVFDLDHRFTYANQALLNMWGKSWSEAIGRNCLELGYEPWHAAMHDREIEQVCETKKPIRGEVPFTGVNGCRIYEYIFVPVIGSDGAVEAVAGTTRDVTERKGMEQALLEADKKKDEFLAMLAHELRNPLAPVRSGLDLLRLSGSDNEVLDVMQRQVEHLVRLVDDLLDVSRIMRGKIRLQTEIVELSGIINRAIETVKPMIDRLQQTVTFNHQTAAVWINADPIRMSQVIGNVLNNASKYSDVAGKIDITTAQEHSQVTIFIKDNGIGISPELLPQVFDLFTQDHQNIDRSQGGLGIGLTVVKSLVEMHGGHVEVKSDGPGHGSEFRLRLPTVLPPVQKLAADLENYDVAPRKILVVDDNVSATIILSKLLSKIGSHTVLTAYDGASALTVIEQELPDLVFLDIGLPKLDGFEVTKKIRQNSNFDHIQVIALTGYGSEDDRRKSYDVGFNAHLVKPPSIDVLRKIIASTTPSTTLDDT